MRLSLATYNIHACIGVDGRFDPHRTLKVLRELGADLIALQEVEHHAVEGRDLLDFFADGLDMAAIAGPTLLRGDRHYGNALLTRLPVSHINRIDLSLPRREPRGALDVQLEWGGRRIQVVATHLGLRLGERRRQVRLLLELFEGSSVDLSALLGDLNEWQLWGGALGWLRRHFTDGCGRAPRTYPGRFPLFALDRVWVRPADGLLGVQAHRTHLARRASDHLPLKALLTLPEVPAVPP
ncbi:endonuclease/exonuclease/phosphatase family protein [Thiocapsa sp.]|uniref:endonuclease/exonuclease/phosphatase family protein n=1 Tax=Thiocapsa sp. TaxID=2024551 RepID=UPI0025D744BE|nr:endonuclease/exonuclease/phosphatase family protein [Thiocapsa sp.]